jgi:heme-degrading monooxygenase HmoA
MAGEALALRARRKETSRPSRLILRCIMILEVAILDIKPGQSPAFEAAFHEAAPIIASMPGYKGHEIRRCMEQADRYILLVKWRRLEDHTEGFRKSAEYGRWKALLHHFYDPFPTVEHYEPVSAG